MENKKCVAFFLGYGWFGVSTPPLMSAQYLAEHGWEVDIYVTRDSMCESLGIARPNVRNSAIHVIYDEVAAKEHAPVCVERDIAIPPYLHNIVQLARERGRHYAWVVGFDAVGLICAAAYAQPLSIPYIYHSLEIYEKNDIKSLEILCQRHAFFSISQDNARADLLAWVNKADRKRIVALPNSSCGAVLPERKSFFQEQFPQIGTRKVVLACGTLLPATCIDTLLAATPGWPADYVLVMHGWVPDKAFYQAVRAFVAQRDNVFLSNSILPPEEKFVIYQSAHICLALYAPLDVNLKYAAGSGGKIYDAMRCGVPLIGNDIPGMKELVQDSGCGVVVRDTDQIGGVLPVVTKFHAQFRARCLEEFPRYEFSGAYQAMLEAYGLA